MCLHHHELRRMHYRRQLETRATSLLRKVLPKLPMPQMGIFLLSRTNSAHPVIFLSFQGYRFLCFLAPVPTIESSPKICHICRVVGHYGDISPACVVESSMVVCFFRHPVMDVFDDAIVQIESVPPKSKKPFSESFTLPSAW